MNLRILFVDDSPDDVDLMLGRLRAAGIEAQWERAQSAASLREALSGRRWELVLVDYNLPGFGGLQALGLLAELAPDVPAVTVSGAISEETAVATIAAGAVDYVLKDNLTRLAPAARRAVEGADLRREQRQAAAQARQTMYAIEHSSQAIVYVTEDGTVLYANAAADLFGGVPPAEAVGEKIWGWSSAVDEERWAELWRAVAQQPSVDFEAALRLPDGQQRLISATLDHHERDEGAFVIVYARDITAQRAVEERAAATEVLYRSIVEMASEGIWAVDDQHVTTFVNPQMAHMLGYEPDEMIGRVDSSFMLAEDLAEQQAQRQTRKKGLPGVYERRFRSKDGVELLISVSSVAELGPEGAFLGSFALCTDITQRKRAEDALQKSEARYRTLFDQAVDGVAIMSVDGESVVVNEAFARMHGYGSPQEMEPLRLPDLDTPETARLAPERLRRLIAGESLSFEVEHFHKDGHRFPLRVSCNVIGIGDEEYLLGFHQDITASRRAEEELRETQTRLQHVIASSPSVIYSLTPDNVATWVAENVEAILGYAVAECLAPGWWAEHVHPDDRQRIFAELPHVLADGQHVQEYRFQYKDGSYRWIRDEQRLIRDAQGNPTEIIGAWHDITERKRSEEELAHSRDLMRYIIEHNQSAVAVHDRDLKYIYVSQRYLREYGVKEHDVIGKHHYDVFPDLPQKWRDVHQKALAGQILSAEDDPYVRADGTVDRTRWECRPWYEADGSIGGIIVYTEVITARKRAEEELARSHDLLTNLARLAPGVIYQYRLYPDGRSAFPYSSPGMNDIYECTPEEVREDATPVFGRLHPDDYDRVAEAIQESARTLDEFYCEFRVILPRQGLRWRWSQAHPERTEDGGTLWHGIISDITERKLAEEELRFTRFIVERAGDAVFWMTADGAFKYANPVTCATLGYSLDELRAMTIHDIDPGFPAERWPEHIKELERAGSLTFETHHRAKDGTVIPMEVTAMYLEFDGDKYDVAFARDITARKHAEDEIRRQAEQLRRTVEGAVLALGLVVETRDPYTAGHERRVAELAAAIAAEMGIGGEQLETLRLAGLIHDIGKIAVPAEILSKPGRLSAVELNLIKEHPRSGFDILGAIDFGLPVAEMVLQHHESLDGSGYPRGLAGEDILPEARILAVADVVEAMSSHRPYRAALGMEAALAEVRAHAGVKYDAEVVATCVRLVEEQGFQFTL